MIIAPVPVSQDFLEKILTKAPFLINPVKKTLQANGLAYTTHTTFLALLELVDGYFVSVYGHYGLCDSRRGQIYNVKFAMRAALVEAVEQLQQELSPIEKNIVRFF